MARTLTFSEAQTRFGPLITTDITVAEAIQEAVDRIYEMGRYPGTTEEVTLAEADFVLDADTDTYHLYFDEDTYAGAIGFRNDHRGWSIVDHGALYKDSLNAGDFEFVDMGSVAYGVPQVTVSGTLTTGSAAVVFPSMLDLGDDYAIGGVRRYGAEVVENEWQYELYRDAFSGVWTLKFRISSVAHSYWTGNSSGQATPDLVTTWTATSPATGTPSILLRTDSAHRKYRCPLGWDPASCAPYYALMKLEAPVLTANDTIPVQGVGALKCAIQAVCYEYVSDDERARMKWAEFDQFMKLNERQVHGPKRMSLGLDSSLKRHPRQFR